MKGNYINIVNEFKKRKIIPVISIENIEDVEPLAKTLLSSNLPIAEITFRTSVAGKAIDFLTKNYPQITTGAGTVLTISNVKEAVESGAKFIITPGFNPSVVDYCISNKIPVFPGVNNPTSVEMALARDLKILKFFPAEASGGVKMIEALNGPYKDISFIATGGINIYNMTDYLNLSNITACGGSWMVKSDMITNKEFQKIETLCKEAVNGVNSWYKSKNPN